MPAEYAVLQLALPDRPLQNIGVLLFEPSTGKLDVSFRDDWDEIAELEDAEVLVHLEDDFRTRIDELGGPAFLESLEDTLSNALRITPRRWAGRRTLGQLFSDHVGGAHRAYSLKAAATRFGEEFVPEAGESDEFVVQVVGRSMEPTIPDGSLCLFRRYRGGSRNGRIYLIERAGDLNETTRYSVKRYRSTKQYTSDEDWQHVSVIAEPDNPEFPSFELREDDRIIGEFIRIVD
jgi:hypothetical protein